jgi:hypothetical protein
VLNGNALDLDRCPHCGIAAPTIRNAWNGVLNARDNQGKRAWFLYGCASCGGAVLAEAVSDKNFEVTNMWPSAPAAAAEIPDRARQFLQQALQSLQAPSGAVMLAASSIDAMLKHMGLKQGSLNSRIDQAAASHLITAEMGTWAHEIRLDANAERHADESAKMPDQADAEKVIAFAQALAQFLFVLPARVARGRKP